MGLRLTVAQDSAPRPMEPVMLARDATSLHRTPLHALHLARGGKMVPFAGYDMPVQYATGVLKEHLHTRAKAGLFDVSHMGQIVLRPKDERPLSDVALALERLVPQDILGLPQGRQRYALFTNERGCILDDLMVAHLGDRLFLVVNAACKVQDEEHLRAHLSAVCEIEALTDRALIALQGPKAADVLKAFIPHVDRMRFMDAGQQTAMIAGKAVTCFISRSGYTGEDGFEISVPEAQAEAFASALLAHDDVWPVGLGARDSLRLEAGLCLYGHDIDDTTTPVEAALEWSIQKIRREGGARAGGFAGADVILPQLAHGATRRRVGLKPRGRAPVREGTALFSDEAGTAIGRVTSGGFSPSLNAPIAMGYLPKPQSPGDAGIAETCGADVRGQKLPMMTAAMPFVATTYKR